MACGLFDEFTSMGKDECFCRIFPRILYTIDEFGKNYLGAPSAIAKDRE